MSLRTPLDVQTHQRRRLASLLSAVQASNPFQSARLSRIGFDPFRDPISLLPLTTRAELEQDQRANPPYGTNLTFSLDRYCRLHQTSGSSSAPLRWLDTAESWDWWKDCWDAVFDAAGVDASDVLFFPFSFGPFVGFWSAFESALRRGNRCLPAGGMTSRARLRYLIDHRATVVCCTPTYALHLAEVARDDGIDLARSPVRSVIVAGEPGGGIPHTRRLIESAWGARLFDHAGMTEVGAWGFEHGSHPDCIYINEREFIAEVIDPATGLELHGDATGELVLTNLGRVGSPLIRYRTGDRVQLVRPADGDDPPFSKLMGGVLGRADDMVIVRGNNVFPSAIEGLVRSVPGVVEFRAQVEGAGALAELRLDLEPAAGVDADLLRRQVEQAIQDALNFRPRVVLHPPGALPRFEFKARRFLKPSP